MELLLIKLAIVLGLAFLPCLDADNLDLQGFVSCVVSKMDAEPKR